MKQRIVIAIALACEPDLLIADEPTTALDVTIQAQILDMMRKLQKEHGTSMILITHDLGVVAEMCDHCAVMYAGEIVEYGTTEQVFDNPKHPYTRALYKSIPSLDKDVDRLDSNSGSGMRSGRSSYALQLLRPLYREKGRLRKIRSAYYRGRSGPYCKMFPVFTRMGERRYQWKVKIS